MLSVLLLDEVPALRAHIAQLIRELLGDGTQIRFFEAGTIDQALDIVSSNYIDIAVIDTVAGGATSLPVPRQIWFHNRSARVMVWTLVQRDLYFAEIISSAPGTASYCYVLKTESNEKLRYAMESAFLHNNSYVDPVFRAGYARRQSKLNRLTEAEKETLGDLILGLTDKGIGLRRGLSVRGAQNRLASLSSKLVAREHPQLQDADAVSVFNPRTRIICEALKSRLIDPEDIPLLEQDFQHWMESQQGSSRAQAS